MLGIWISTALTFGTRLNITCEVSHIVFCVWERGKRERQRRRRGGRVRGGVVGKYEEEVVGGERERAQLAIIQTS